VLVPVERTDRTFTDYNRAHRLAAMTQDEDSPAFDMPEVGSRYPCSSLPALEAAAWVREAHPERFWTFDLAVFEAFFDRTEDISSPQVLARIAASAGLDPAALDQILATGRLRPVVLQEHAEATSQGFHNVPTILIPGHGPVVGAVPYADLGRTVQRVLGRASPHERTARVSDGPETREGNARS
jgi:predicted DsbA family dithiol-disulfide isomerase